MTTIKRRKLIKSGLAVGTALAAGFPAIHVNAQDKSLKGKTIRLLTWADSTGEALIKNVVEPFQKLTGARVIADRTGGTSDMIAKLKAAGDRPQYDVITLAGVGEYTLGNDGLLAKPDFSMIPNLQNVPERFRTSPSGFGVGYLLWTVGLIYNTKTFSHAPDSYEELWNPEFKKRLFLPPAHWADALDTIDMAARLAGGSMKDPEAGFQKLAELKDSVLLFGENTTQIGQMFRANQLDIGAVYPPATLSKFIADPSYNMSATYDCKEGFYADLMFSVIPKSHPGEDDAIYSFINYTLDPKVQGIMAEAVLNGPINKETVLSSSAQDNPLIIKPSQFDQAIIHDRDLLASVREEWIKRYSQIFS